MHFFKRRYRGDALNFGKGFYQKNWWFSDNNGREVLNSRKHDEFLNGLIPLIQNCFIDNGSQLLGQYEGQLRSGSAFSSYCCVKWNSWSVVWLGGFHWKSSLFRNRPRPNGAKPAGRNSRTEPASSSKLDQLLLILRSNSSLRKQNSNSSNASFCSGKIYLY